MDVLGSIIHSGMLFAFGIRIIIICNISQKTCGEEMKA